MTPEFVSAATLVGLALIVILLLLFTTGRIGDRDRLANGLGHEIERLNKTVDTLLTRNDEVIKHNTDLLAEIVILRNELVRTQADLKGALERINVLVGKVSATGVTIGRPAKPLLLVMCNTIFGEDDAAAIRRTGIPFHRLRNATSDDFDRYLQGCRQDNATPWYVQLSAHMGVEGVQFADTTVSANWLQQRIRGIQVLVMAGCTNERVASQLVGLAQFVVIVYESIDTTNAQDFSFAFWSRIASNSDPVAAFAGALAECPQVSEFVQMRSVRST